MLCNNWGHESTADSGCQAFATRWCAVRRRYTLHRRAASQAETHRRIVEAAVELHRRLGPARTSLSAVAELAAVQRHTLYRHFPDEAALLRACREHFIGSHPLPDTTRWLALPAGPKRLRIGLAELYAYYAANRDLIGNVLRDADVLPVGGALRAGIAARAATLTEGWRTARPAALRAAVRLATDFHAWRTLAESAKPGPTVAAELMSDMVACAARAPRASRPNAMPIARAATTRRGRSPSHAARAS